MATTIRRSISVAALAAALVLSACGGGGGGGSTPPTNPPAATDTTAPRMTSVTPTNGATGVAPTTSVEAVFDEPLKCDSVSGQTVQVAGVTATASCDSSGKKIALSMQSALPIDTLVTATLPAATDMAGNQAQPVSVTFRTVAPVVTNSKVYAALLPQIDGSRAVAVIDTTTNAVKHVDFPGVPGFGPLYATVTDALTGKVYFAGRLGFQIYVVDLVTDAVLAPIKLDPAFTVNHAIWDLVLTDAEVCAAMSDAVPAGTSRNRLQCWDRFTNAVTYNGANNSLASDEMFVNRLRTFAAPTKSLYALAALRSAVSFPSPGTPGKLVRINPVTKAVLSTYDVGSVPFDFDVDAATGDVWVTNAGDKTVSVLRAATNQVETWTPPAPRFTGLHQRPYGIAADPGKDRVYITDAEGLLVVYRLSTRQELALVNLGVGSLPGRIMIRGHELWVACSGGMITVVDRDSLTVTKTIMVGPYPNAFASYAPPGNAQ